MTDSGRRDGRACIKGAMEIRVRWIEESGGSGLTESIRNGV